MTPIKLAKMTLDANKVKIPNTGIEFFFMCQGEYRVNKNQEILNVF